MTPLNDNDFIRLYQFIQKDFGIDLSKKKALIENRLGHVITNMGFPDFTKYIDYILSSGSQADLEILLNKLTTNYTYFMREPTHFDYFKDTILPGLVQRKKNKTMNIWSAGCSSGEEPYTISMIIKDFLGSQASKWDTRVLATDISQNVLSTATNAVYPSSSLSNLPTSWKQKYFIETGNGNEFRVSPDIKSNVIFRTFNLMSPIKFKTNFDIIFCRNVMIYFDQSTKDALVNRFYHATDPGGYLLIGHSETVNKDTSKYNYIMPATYQKI